MGQRKKKKNRKSKPFGPSSSHVGPPIELTNPFADGTPDRRVMEDVMRQLVDQFGEESDDSPLARAQQLMYEAFDARDPEQQIQMAQQALAISDDCADAYVLLGEYAGSPQEALKIYEQGMAAGRRALGEQAFEELEGYFWGYLETRPYMRARLELVNVLLHLSEREQAAAHLQDMLRLNPNDNQGVRYVLLGVLIELDRDAAAYALIDQYAEDRSAEWHYGRALLAFRREDDTPTARKLLAEATKTNPHVPPYLAGFKTIPTYAPPYVSLGEESEAQSYASAHLRCWKATPGAIPWLRKAAGVARDQPRMPRQQSWKGFPPDLADLPQDEDEVWHVDLRRLASKASNKGDRPWAILVTSPLRDQLLATELAPEKPSNNDALRLLANIMSEPDDNQPRRPAAIHVRLKTLCNAWTNKLAAVGIECQHAQRMEDIDMLHQRMVAQIEQQTARSNMPAISDEELDELPQVPEEIWQADVRLLATWFGDEATPLRPWLAIVSNRSEGTILAQDLSTDEPQDSRLTQVIRQAMSNPSVGDPHRPGLIAVHEGAFHDALQPWLANRNIDCELQEELDHLDFLYDDFTKHMCGDEPAAALLDAPGVDPQHVAGVFDAAAEFYRQKPWRSTPGDVPIKVECDRFESGPWYAVVMGQIGACEGIALYDDYDRLMKMLTGQMSDAENAHTMSALSLQFNEPFEIPNLDLHHAEKYGWPIAGPEAYPTIMRINPGMEVRPPLVWELQLMEACLRAVPQFFAATNDAQREVEVNTSSGPIKVRISWP